MIARLADLPIDAHLWIAQHGAANPRGFVGHRADFRPELLIDATGRSLVKLSDDLHWYEQWTPHAWRLITAPRGTLSDGASIPRPLHVWPGNPLEGAFLRAAMVHDWLYRVQSVDRDEADAVFHRALRVDGVGRVKAWAMHAGVRVGGHAPWRRYAQGLAS